MSEAKTWWEKGELRRINIPVPNADLARWLKGKQCRAEVERVTSQIFSYYQNSLPVRTGNLKAGADYYMDISGWGVEKDRWFGWVTNTARSYNKTRNEPYAGTVEYGNARFNIPAGNQLRNAAALVAGDISAGRISVSGVSNAPEGRGSTLRSDKSGRFVANPLNYDRDRKTK